ncbi:MAG TPA: potassium-transporting ATPase subunit KdpC [Polyangiaceae bacterium]
MLEQLRAALVAIVFFTALTGVVYPLAVTGVAQVAFHRQANGSLIEKNGKVVGSELIGRQWNDPKYFWGRVSATLDANGKALAYNAQNSGGSNLGPTNSALADEVKARLDVLEAADPENGAPVPVDLVTSSGSGLDPDISVEAAEYQIHRIARARAMNEREVRAVVRRHVVERTLGFLGEPRVNVQELNLALDEL